MPVKGTKKPQGDVNPNQSKEHDTISIDDILFPRSSIQKLAKNIIQNGGDEQGSSNMIMARESLTALQRSATVFVSYLMFNARLVSREQGKKTVGSQDIINSIERIDFSGLVPQVKLKITNLEGRKESQKEEKKGVQLAQYAHDCGDDSMAHKKLKNEASKPVSRTEKSTNKEQESQMENEEEEEEEPGIGDYKEDEDPIVEEEKMKVAEENEKRDQTNPISELEDEHMKAYKDDDNADESSLDGEEDHTLC